MNAWWLAALLSQDPEVVLSARAKKGAEGYELQVRGEGPGLSEEAKVSLRFRRMVNRLDWAEGSISTVPLDPPWIRSASATAGTFSYREVLRGLDELAIEVVVETPDGRAKAPVGGRVRVAAGHEVAAALRRDVRRTAAALESARERLDEVVALAEAPACPASARKLDRVRKKLERQRAGGSEEASGTTLSATAILIDGFLADLERVSAGKGFEGAVSGLSGEPLSPAEARRNLETIERVALREQALALLREVQEVRREVGQAAATGCPFRWARVEESAEKSLTALRVLEEDLRSGPQGPRFAEAADGENGATLGKILEGTREFFNAAASAMVCPRSVEGEMERLECGLNELGARLEHHLRGIR